MVENLHVNNPKSKQLLHWSGNAVRGKNGQKQYAVRSNLSRAPPRFQAINPEAVVERALGSKLDLVQQGRARESRATTSAGSGIPVSTAEQPSRLGEVT